MSSLDHMENNVEPRGNTDIIIANIVPLKRQGLKPERLQLHKYLTAGPSLM
jgi:hypothetical protein